MKLYRLSQEEFNGYDTYDSCVVCAKDEEDAKTITPNGVAFGEEARLYPSWAVNKESVVALYLGKADKTLNRGVICASFNAG